MDGDADAERGSDWLMQFDVRNVSLAPPHGGGGTEVRFWTNRPLTEVAAHFAERTGEAGEQLDGDRLVWTTDRYDGQLRRLRTMVVEAAPGVGTPTPPDDAVTVVWVSDLVVPVSEPIEEESTESPDRRRRFWQRR